MLTHVLCLLISLVHPNHDFHTSWMTVTYDQSDKEFEVEWKTDPEHLEYSLSNFSGETIRFEDDKMNIKVVDDYINKHVQLNFNKKKQSLKVASIQIEYNEISIVLEPIDCRRRLKQISMNNEVLIDDFPGQKNMVQFFYKDQKMSHLFHLSETTYFYKL